MQIIWFWSLMFLVGREKICKRRHIDAFLADAYIWTFPYNQLQNLEDGSQASGIHETESRSSDSNFVSMHWNLEPDQALDSFYTDLV